MALMEDAKIPVRFWGGIGILGRKSK